MDLIKTYVDKQASLCGRQLRRPGSGIYIIISSQCGLGIIDIVSNSLVKKNLNSTKVAPIIRNEKVSELFVRYL